MTSALARRNSEPPPERPAVHGVKLEVCNLDYLKESYGRLYKLHQKGVNNGAPFSHPHPTNLKSKESLVRSIGNWMLVHGDTESGAECDRCGGPMDISLCKKKQIPDKCVYCADGPIEYGDAPSSPENEAPEEDGDEEDSGEEIDEDPPPSELAPATKKKAGKKVANQKVVRVKRGSKAPPADDGAGAEVVGKEAQGLLDVVEKIRGLTTGAVTSFNDNMWESGRLLAELKKSKLWQKHPSSFATWRDFVEGCFGQLYTEKIAESAIGFYLENKGGAPKLGEGAKIPRLPAKPNPRPKVERAVDTSDTGPQHDPNFISFAGSFKRKLRIAMLTEKGKPAKKIGDRPFAIIRSENGVELKIVVAQNPKGELVLNVAFSRE